MTTHLERMQNFDEKLGYSTDRSNIVIPFMGESEVAQAMATVQDCNGYSQVEDTQIVYDMDSVLTTANSAKDSFDNALKSQLSAEVSSAGAFVSPFMHCFAVKACPVSYILHSMVQNGMGLECASIIEVKQSLRCGCPPSRVIFDSPCKTTQEINDALQLGVNFNINSVKELEKVNEVWTRLSTDPSHAGVLSRYAAGESFIGLRVNPLVGAGNIAALSVATPFSKFGIPLYSPEYILGLFQRYSYLNGIMCHVGSQGMSIDHMVRGVRALLDVAQLVEETYSGPGGRLHYFDIGGGLSVNYLSDSVTPSFDQYAQALLAGCPELFLHANLGPSIARPTNRWRIATEFGKALISKTACVVSRVEDVIYHNPQDKYVLELDVDVTEVNQSEPLVTAVIHAGADLFLRQCYCPEKFKHRCVLVDDKFQSIAFGRQHCKRVAVAGPLCFGGDVVQLATPMHLPTCGDFIVALDGGANTISLFSRHCSRPSPSVYAVRRRPATQGGGMVGCRIREAETVEDVCAFWG